MKPQNKTFINLAVVVLLLLVAISLIYFKVLTPKDIKSLKIAISPYQDIAMLVNYKELNLEQKYSVQLELRSMAWEDILPAVASGGETVDVGFGSLTEYLTKYDKLNGNSKDPIVFIFPLYVYKGGGFISFKPSIKPLTSDTISNPDALKQFLGNKIGAQKQSIYEMVLFSLARRADINPKELHILDLPMNESFLATQNGSVDIASAGLTQITETLRNNGRVVLTMDDAGFADITGFIARQSILRNRKSEIQALIKVWFDCVGYVMSDPNSNSKVSLEYLRKNAATRYSLEEYKTALEQEYLPPTLDEACRELILSDGRFSIERIGNDVADYLIVQKLVPNRPPIPIPIDLKN